MNDQQPLYDRDLLLSGTKRNAVLELWEVQQYGRDSFGDADYVSIYDMRPAEWHARGVRILGRTAVECTRDRLADAIARDVARLAATCPSTARALIADPFAGSGNTLYWLQRCIPGARAVGVESDAGVFRLARQSIEALGLPIDIQNTDYLSGLTRVLAARDELLIVFIAPPWGNALDRTSGLDLRRTTPPIIDITEFLLDRFAGNQLLCAIQTYEIVVPISMIELRARFDWSTIRMYPSTYLDRIMELSSVRKGGHPRVRFQGPRRTDHGPVCDSCFLALLSRHQLIHKGLGVVKLHQRFRHRCGVNSNCTIHLDVVHEISEKRLDVAVKDQADEFGVAVDDR
jgi:hypothetical protein